jgi:hypothetical protein
VVASAFLVAQYYGVGPANPDGTYAAFGVDESGGASVGKLTDFLRESGLRCVAYDGMSTWYLRKYLSRYDCCMVLIMPQDGTSGRHAVTLFRGVGNGVVKCDLLDAPHVVTVEGLLRTERARGWILVIVSREELPSPMRLRIEHYGAAYLVAIVLLAATAIGVHRGLRQRMVTK